MTVEIQNVEIKPGNPPVLVITTNGETSTVPLNAPVMALLNAGGWLMREYVARTFEADLGSTNVISRRIRMMHAGERPPG
jgi:hypothetical protein